jgi:hypothetical protein
MSILFNSINQFVEQVGRRTTQRFGTVLNYLFVYTGPQSGYSAWAKQLGSSPDGFPLLYLSNIEKRNLAANVMEVTLYYIGTDQQRAQYSDLQITTDLATRSWSWSGLAEIVSAITPYIAQFTITFEYKTIEVTFSYTAYKYGGALFSGQAANYAQILSAYAVSSYGSVQVGVGPRVGPPYVPNLVLTRFTCEQLAPIVWKCVETWSLNYNMKTLGFPVAE